jgi:UTP--glucose-1-phosphate uridylyltransferase
MLALIDRPAIQYLVEEAAAAGLDDVLIVTGRNKSVIEDHFDRVPELEDRLAQDGKKDLLAEVEASTAMARVHFVRQREALGLGHAVSVARWHVGDESFAVLLGDDLMHPSVPLLRRMLDVHRETGGHVVSLLEVAEEDVEKYGIASVGSRVADDVVLLDGLVEKPAVSASPSRLAVSGRYVFGPSIFPALDVTQPGRGGEIQLTDAIDACAGDGEVYGVTFTSGRYDVGNKLDYLKATVQFAHERDDLGADFDAFLVDFVRRNGLI